MKGELILFGMFSDAPRGTALHNRETTSHVNLWPRQMSGYEDLEPGPGP